MRRLGGTAARRRLRLVPGWVFVPGFFAGLVLVGLAVYAFAGTGSTTRLVAAGTAFAVLGMVLVVRAKDGWEIYGTMWLVGTLTGMLPIAVGLRVALQITVSTGLVYVLCDSGWLDEESEGEQPQPQPSP